MRIQLLGPVRVWRHDIEVDLGPAAQRALFGVLALASGQPVPRAELVDALWGDWPPPTAANVIQTHVKRLRARLEPDRPPRTPSALLPTVGAGYALHIGPDATDLTRFRRLVIAAAAAGQNDRPRAAGLLADAVGLWLGPPLADVPVLASHPKVLSLSRERWAAVARYGDAMIAVGSASDALPALEEAAAAQPLDEAAHARLIRGYHAAGRRARAFAAYEEIRRGLAEELGVDPGPELAAAHAVLLRQDAIPAPRTPAARTPAGPTPATTTPATTTAAATATATASAATAPPVPPEPAQLPADVPAFTGRADELTELHGLLPTDDEGDTAGAPTTIVISAVSGTAGVGKSALAVRWAHRVRRRFPDGQLFVDLRGYDPDQPLPPGVALARFLVALGVPGPDIPLDDDERAAAYRTLLDGRRVLVVLDNAASVEQVRLLLPGSAGCAVVVTSRDPLAGLVARYGAHRLDLDVLPAAEAVALLRALVGSRVDAEPAVAGTLARQCALLPLALRVAAELAAARPTLTLAELCAELADLRRRLERLSAGGDARTAVRTVFSWSYQHLPPDAARLFRLLGLHPGPDLDPYAVAALADSSLDDAHRLLRALAQAHLVQPTAAGRYGMHDLLRAYAAGLVAGEDTEADRAAASTRLLDYYLGTAASCMDTLYPAEGHNRPWVPPAPTPTPAVDDTAIAQAWLDRERVTLVAAAQAAADGEGGGWPTHATRLARTLFRYLDAGGHYPDALAIHTSALRSAERTGDPAAQAHALTSLGTVYHRLVRYPQAADHYQRALALFLAAGDGKGEARTLMNLGAAREWQGSYEEAADHFQRALTLFRAAGDGVGEARALTSLGAVRRRQGRYAQAADHYQHALSQHRRTGDRIGEARVLANLGVVCLRQGQLGPAAEHQQRALALYRESGERSGEAYALDNLGLVRQRQGEYEFATEHHEQALAIYRQTGDRDGEAEALTNLGSVHLRQQRCWVAIDHHRQALAIYREIGGRAGEVSVLNGLGEARLEAGEPEQARAHHATALALAVAIGDRYEQARAHAGIALTHRAGADEARRHQDEALALYRDLGVPEVDHSGLRPASAVPTGGVDGSAVQSLSS